MLSVFGDTTDQAVQAKECVEKVQRVQEPYRMLLLSYIQAKLRSFSCFDNIAEKHLIQAETSPYSFQGLGKEGIDLLIQARR